MVVVEDGEGHRRGRGHGRRQWTALLIVVVVVGFGERDGEVGTIQRRV